MHIVYTIANESSVPYFKWFADEAAKHPELKFTFVVLFHSKPQMLEDMQQRNCDCYWIHFDSNKRKRGMVRALFQLKKLFKKLEPDVVHTHLFDDSVPGLLAAKWAKVPIRVITKQDTTFHYYYKPAYVRFDRMNNKNATHIHAVASRNRDFILQKEKASAKKIHLIRNGFPEAVVTNSNEKTIKKIKHQYNLNERFVVGTVARYIDWKNHKLIIQAAKELAQKIPAILFLWAGTGEQGYVKSLKNEVMNAGLQNNITFCGWIEREEMPSFYKCLDVYLHPAKNEPFGFAISEALFNQVPVAATRTGSTDLITNQKDGIIVKEDSVSSVVDAIEWLYHHPAEKQQMAIAGYQHAKENLSFKRMFDETIALYKKALNIT